MKRTLAVVDSNVLVAGLLTKDRDSPTARILDAMLEARLSYLVSVELLAEYREVLLRPRLREAHGLGEQEVDRILTDIALNAIVVEPETAKTSAPDAGDQHVWDLLLSRPGAVLVSGDRLLVREAPSGSSAVSPRVFAELMGWT